MKLLVNDNEIITATGYSWSGSKSSISRVLDFSVVINNPKIPSYEINTGDTVVFTDDNDVILFQGQITNQAYSKSRDVISYSANDYLFNLQKSKAVGRFKGTIVDVYSNICSTFGLTSTLESESTTVHNIISTGDKTYYEILNIIRKSVYGNNSNININGKNLDVQISTLPVVELDTDLNILDIDYSSDIQDMINQVKYIDKTGNILETYTSDNDASTYGLLIDVHKYQKNEDNVNISKNKLKSIKNECNISALGDNTAITGNYLTVIDGLNKADFEIISDNHSFSPTGYTMQLGVKI